jgi:hypothetical protein
MKMLASSISTQNDKNYDQSQLLISNCTPIITFTVYSTVSQLVGCVPLMELSG